MLVTKVKEPFQALAWAYVATMKPSKGELEWQGELSVGPGRILLIFPQQYELFLEAWRAVQETGVDDTRLVLFAPRPFLQALKSKGREIRIPYEASEVGRTGLAKRKLLDRVKQVRTPVALDLEERPSPLGAQVAVKSGAVVRASLADCPVPKVFNFVVRSPSSSGIGDRVASLFAYLGFVDREAVTEAY